MYIHTEIKTYRHTQTNRQTDSAEVQEGRQKNIQMYRKTIAYLKTDRQTDRQTERQNRQAQNIQAQKDKGTDRQIEGSISVLCKNIQIEIWRLKKLATDWDWEFFFSRIDLFIFIGVLWRSRNFLFLWALLNLLKKRSRPGMCLPPPPHTQTY